MPRKPKDERGAYTERHDRFVPRDTVPAVPPFRAPPPRPDYIDVVVPENAGDSTGIKLILQQVGLLNKRTYEMHGVVSTQGAEIHGIREEVHDIKGALRSLAAEEEALKSRVDRHSSNLSPTAQAKKKTINTPVEFFFKNFSTIIKIIVLTIIGLLFLLGIMVSVADLGKIPGL
jgi:hypothetical protein